MNGSDYNKMVDNFKASSELKQSTINAAHSRVFKKLKITKRERIIRYSSVAAMFAMVVVLFFVFDVGGAFSFAGNSMKGNTALSSGSDTSQPSTEKATVKSTEASTQMQIVKEQDVVTTVTNTSPTTAAITATTAPTTAQTIVPTTAPATAKTDTTTSSMQIWNGATTYTNVWTSTNSPISTAKYDFSGSTGSIDVNSLSITSTGNLLEAKVGPNEKITVRTEVHPALFKSGLVVTKSGDGIVTFTNDNEGIILRENIVSYPKEASESQSAYASRCINYLIECCTDATKSQQGFSLSSDYAFNTKSAIIMTNSDTEWRALMKLNYTGNPIAALSKTTYGGFGYLTIVFDRSSQCFLVQTYVVQNSLSSTMSTVCYGVKYKVN